MTNEEKWLEEYKSRADFYKKFIEYLSEECVGNKDNIILRPTYHFKWQ